LQIVQIDGGEEKLVIGAQVSGETAAALRRLAAAGERTLSAEIRIALRKHLDSRRVRVHPPQERKVA
jgi:Ribbon-helix-helix protein, copG family